jgi:hypothetical protein
MKQHSNNTLTGSFSAILGGSGNNDAGFNFVGIYGIGITAVASRAFHAENYVVQNMPLAFGLGATCQLRFLLCGSGDRAVVIG